MEKQKSKKKILKKRAKQEKKGAFSKIVKYALWTLLIGAFAAVLVGIGVYKYISQDLPKISSLKDYRPPIITTVYSDDNRKIAEFYKERRVIIPLSDMPEGLVNAFIAAEDARFYHHEGIDFISIIRAFVKNIEAGTIVQGGSTITQQVTKSFLLTPERSYRRKLREAILAYRIDKSFAKEEILFLYLNQIYLGHGSYGVEAAAQNYFGKSVKDLTLSECAILGGLPQAPSDYSPFRHPEKARQRQIYVLNRMVAEEYITNIEATEAINEPWDIKPRRNWFIEKVPYYTEHVRRYLEDKYGKKMLYEGGLKVYTAVNIEMQKTARDTIRLGLEALDKRQGFRGPLNHLSPEEIETFSADLQAQFEEDPLEKGKVVKAVVLDVDAKRKLTTVRMGNARGVISIKNMKWARKPNPKVAYYNARVSRPEKVLKAGDVILVKLMEQKEGKQIWDLGLEQIPKAQSALLCMEAETGHVKVMVGGRDFKTSQFNRAIQSRRQPGSAFKPIVYAAALDKGYTPAKIIYDSPIVYENEANDQKWKPKNYEKRFYGPTLLRQALAHSRNVVTIKILKDIGVDYTIEYAKKLGIHSNINKDLSIALGSSGVSLLELVNAYSVFANMGYRLEPAFILKIEDRDGNILEEYLGEREKVIEKSTAYIMTSLLESVVQEGTGRRVRALKRPVAGKTGTTNNLFDAWFVGYTPQYITGTWVGFDEEASLGKSETGSRAASPIWLEFMKRVLEDKPVKVFTVPDGVVFSKIDASSGLLPIKESKKTIFECFKEGTEPKKYTPRSDEVTVQTIFKDNL